MMVLLYVDLWPIRQERGFGAHLIKSPCFADEENESLKEEGTY